MSQPQIPKKMKAIQVVEFKKPYEIREVDVPQPDSLTEHDILVKVAIASNCHTDSMVQDGVFGGPLPQTASHEGAGTVVAVGTAAQKSGFKVGDRVINTIDLNNTTDEDEETPLALGGEVEGVLSQFAVFKEKHLLHMPAHLSWEEVSSLSLSLITCI